MQATWKEAFQRYLNRLAEECATQNIDGMTCLTEQPNEREQVRWRRVFSDMQKRHVQTRRVRAQAGVDKTVRLGNNVHVYYRVQWCWQMRHWDQNYEQRYTQKRCCLLRQSPHWSVQKDIVADEEGKSFDCTAVVNDNGLVIYNPNEKRAVYDREAVVDYANRWWDSYNPKFRHFDVDCTNYVSQCVWAGGAPMKHASDRANGWWYRFSEPVDWSFSWAVAHSMRWFLAGSRSGLQATEVSSADQLVPGDIICYDFDGDGRWDHTTIVVARDGAGMPLVNAHTSNSRNRYWEYRDSPAWTDSIQYKFFHVYDHFE